MFADVEVVEVAVPPLPLAEEGAPVLRRVGVADGARLEHQAQVRVTAEVVLHAQGDVAILGRAAVVAAHLLQEGAAEPAQRPGDDVDHAELALPDPADVDGQQVFQGLQPGEQIDARVAHAQVAGHADHRRVVEVARHVADHVVVERGVAVHGQHHLARGQLQAKVQGGDRPAPLPLGHHPQRAVRHPADHRLHGSSGRIGAVILDGPVHQRDDLDEAGVALFRQRGDGPRHRLALVVAGDQTGHAGELGARPGRGKVPAQGVPQGAEQDEQVDRQLQKEHERHEPEEQLAPARPERHGQQEQHGLAGLHEHVHLRPAPLPAGPAAACRSHPAACPRAR